MEPKKIVELHKILGILLTNSHDFLKSWQATTICHPFSLIWILPFYFLQIPFIESHPLQFLHYKLPEIWRGNVLVKRAK